MTAWAGSKYFRTEAWAVASSILYGLRDLRHIRQESGNNVVNRTLYGPRVACFPVLCLCVYLDAPEGCPAHGTHTHTRRIDARRRGRADSDTRESE